jgi:hypothetical protein
MKADETTQLFLVNGHTGYPVDAEIEFNDLGRSAGFVHLKCPDTGKCLTWCGVDYFEQHAIYIP